jgi:hypothetical protein
MKSQHTGLFSADPGKILDFSGKRPADIFNESILPKVNSFLELSGTDPGGLEARAQEREQQLERDLAVEEQMFDRGDEDFLSQMQQRNPLPAPGQDYSGLAVSSEDYDAPVPKPAEKGTGGFIKLANYGYASDSSPDYNSNVLKIGHSNNKLVDGVSAALTRSLAIRHGIRKGQEFEIVTADGKTLRRRYDDTVPTTYKGKPLPETVDLYNTKGSNNFGGKVIEIRPINQ